MQHDDREMSVPGPETDRPVSVPIPLRQRRSVGCFPLSFRGRLLGCAALHRFGKGAAVPISRRTKGPEARFHTRSEPRSPTTTLRLRRDRREKFHLESRCLGQPFGDRRPRVLDEALPAPVVVRAFPEPGCFGQGTELAFGFGVAFPVIAPNNSILRADGGKHPRLDVLRRRTQDDFLATFTFPKPVEHHPSQSVRGAVRRWTRLFARQVIVRCVPNISPGICLARHIRIDLHDQHVMVRQYGRAGHRTATFRGRLTTPAIDPSPSGAGSTERCGAKGCGAFRLQRLKHELAIRQQRLQNRLQHNRIGRSFGGNREPQRFRHPEHRRGVPSPTIETRTILAPPSATDFRPGTRVGWRCGPNSFETP